MFQKQYGTESQDPLAQIIKEVHCSVSSSFFFWLLMKLIFSFEIDKSENFNVCFSHQSNVAVKFCVCVCVFFCRQKMKTLYLTRDELALIILYLNKAEARDKICRAIQYGSKFLSGGKPGTAQNVYRNTSLARKVFRLFKVIVTLPFPSS